MKTKAPVRDLRSFRRDEDGATAITFALTLFPAVLVIACGIDYGRATAERDKLQQGTDAGALVGIQSLRRGQTLVQLSPTVSQVVATNDISPYAGVSNITVTPDGTQLCVRSQSQVPTTLMNVAGYRYVNIGAYSCAKMNPDTYEIAFAIDNSQSMSNSAQSGGMTKMQYAQQAANNLITTLAPNPNTGASGVSATYAVVPFSSSVNVGSNLGVSNLGQSWLDLNGQSSIHWASFTMPSPLPKNWTRPKSLFDMLSTMGVSWGGCVEERPSPYTTSDDTPSPSLPDTLFAPFFSPDETDNNQAALYYNNSQYNKLTFNNYVTDNSGMCTSGDAFAVADQKNARGDGQTKLCKYTGKIASTSNSYYVTGQTAGPNAGCATPPVTTLNLTQKPITDAIAAMTPIGDTALAPGFMWAWRTLSPKGPFASVGSRWSTSGQQQPKPYGYVDPNTTAVNHKILILLTDGMNDWFGQDNDGYTQYTQYDPNKMVYNAFGYPQEGRLTNGNTTATTTSTARGLLDQTTLNACTAAKATVDPNGNAAPIEIYTVGFLATDGIDAAGKTLLQNCATDSSHAFLAQTGDDLVQVFQKIASQITQPRITQ